MVLVEEDMMGDSGSHHTVFQVVADSKEPRLVAFVGTDMVTAGLDTHAPEIRRGSRTVNSGSCERRRGCEVDSRYGAGRTEVHGRCTYLRLGLDLLSVSVETLYSSIASCCGGIRCFQGLETDVPDLLVLICGRMVSESVDGETLGMALASGRVSVVCGSRDDVPPHLQSVCLCSTPSDDHVEVAVSGSALACFRALLETAGDDDGVPRHLSDGCSATALSSLLLCLLHAQALSIWIDVADASESLWAGDEMPLYRPQA